jgi:DNA-directed RNA polymerase subunit K/omega
MLSTLRLDELVKSTENVYEAIIIIAKRACQINAKLKKQQDLDDDNDSLNDDFSDEEIDRRHQEYKRDAVRPPKPTTVALNEFLEGKLTFSYPEIKENA